MSNRNWPLGGVLAAALTAAAVGPAVIAQGPEVVTPKAEYKAPRTPWGHPDFQGIWTSDSVMGVPVEKAIENPSPEDLARQKKIRDVEAKLDASGSNVVFEERELKWTIKKPASLVTDPPDGRIPLTPKCRSCSTIRHSSVMESASNPGPISICGIAASARAIPP